MEIGGNDEVYEIQIEPGEARRSVIASLRKLWPEAIIEDANEQVIPFVMSDDDILHGARHRLLNTPEMFAYENEAARQVWAKNSAGADLATVMHLIWGDRQLTIVWDEKPTALDRINVRRFLSYVRETLETGQRFVDGPRELKTTWSLEAQADVKAVYGVNEEAEVVRFMGDQVSKDLTKVLAVRAREWAAAAWHVRAFCLLMRRVRRVVDGAMRVVKSASIKAPAPVRLKEIIMGLEEAYATQTVGEILGGE